MTYLNSQQLAFILDIPKEDARARMCNAWCKEKGIEKNGSLVAGVRRVKNRRIVDPYPQAMHVDMLATHLNLPDLQKMVDDIVNNYLVRPSSKKWILCDYPEKQIIKAERDGKQPPYKLSLPPALRSMLSAQSVQTVYDEWKRRYPVEIK